MPWKLYGELRGLKAPPRRNCAGGLDLLRVRKICSRLSIEHGPAMMAISSPPTLTPLVELDDGAFRAEGAAGQLVGRADAVDESTPGSSLYSSISTESGGADAGQNGLRGAGGAVYVDASLDHAFDDGVDLFFGCVFLHCYDHCLFPVSGDCTPASWPAAAAWAFLWLANSFLCKARMTSMMRSKMCVSSISGNGPLLAARTFS
jgi:hypothetical protein